MTNENPSHDAEECFICHFYWPCQIAEKEADQ